MVQACLYLAGWPPKQILTWPNLVCTYDTSTLWLTQALEGGSDRRTNCAAYRQGPWQALILTPFRLARATSNSAEPETRWLWRRAAAASSSTSPRSTGIAVCRYVGWVHGWDKISCVGLSALRSKGGGRMVRCFCVVGRRLCSPQPAARICQVLVWSRRVGTKICTSWGCAESFFHGLFPHARPFFS